MIRAPGRDNCFDLIRHGAACTVLFSHQFALLKLGEPTIRQWETFGFVAIATFFAISGYLMVGAFERTSDFLQFMGRRLRRLLPAMVVCAFLMTYVLGAIYTPQPLGDYLTSVDTLRNWASWSLFMAHPMPGVFADFIVPNAVNGSLWTLPMELVCYVVLAAALSTGKRLPVVLALFTGSILGTMWIVQNRTGYSFYGVLLNYFFVFGISFTAGALMAITEATWFPRRLQLIAFAAFSIWLLRGKPEIHVLGSLGISILTIVVGRSFRDNTINGRFDISYGIYIYAFPIQQLVINTVTTDLWTGMLISLVLTICAGTLSYLFVERHFLRPDKAPVAPPPSLVRQTEPAIP